MQVITYSMQWMGWQWFIIFVRTLERWIDSFSNDNATIADSIEITMYNRSRIQLALLVGYFVSSNEMHSMDWSMIYRLVFLIEPYTFVPNIFSTFFPGEKKVWLSSFCSQCVLIRQEFNRHCPPNTRACVGSDGRCPHVRTAWVIGRWPRG